MAQVISASTLEARTRDQASVLLESGDALLTILNDILDMSKISAGKLEITPENCDLIACLRQVERLFRPLAESKRLSFRLVCGDEERLPLKFDPVRLSQCISNLVSNAIKFTRSGEIVVTLEMHEARHNRFPVVVTVRDTGIGMSPDAVANLFQPFAQADGATTREFGGTGLGLTIARSLARMMGGDVSVVSCPGAGTVFTLSILAEQASGPVVRNTEARFTDATVPEVMPAAAGAPRVLLVDDQPINRQVVKLFLSPLYASVVEAANGQEALDRLAAEPFDLVLLDIHMPVMDGRECIRRIRASNQTWAGIPTIALTADAMAGDREALLALGMTDYVSKPIDRQRLLKAVAKLIGAGAASGGSEATIHTAVA
jgi:CheY-like chemotaxis protein